MSPPSSTAVVPWAMTAFGMYVVSDIPLPGAAPQLENERRPDLQLVSVRRADLEDLTDAPRHMRYLHSFEGCGYAMLEGLDGDVLFHYRERALFHLSSDHDVLRCAISERGTAWQRVLLDTVFWAVSLLKGFELLHASAVVTPQGLVAVVGPSGAGKTTLSIELVKRGGVMFSDDIVALQEHGAEVVAHPGPPLLNVPRSVAPWDPGAWKVLAELGDEDWVSVRRVLPPPQPIRAIVLVSLGATAARCRSIAASSLEVLPHMVTFTHLVDERRRQQFDVAGGLAAGAALMTLSRPLSAEPSALADLVLECLAGAAATGVSR